MENCPAADVRGSREPTFVALSETAPRFLLHMHMVDSKVVDLVPSSRSKPTAFQAVSFQPTARWWGGPPGPRGSPRTRFRTASPRPRRGTTTKRPTWASAPISGGGLGVRPTTNHALTSGSGGFSRNPAFSRNPTHRPIGGGCLVPPLPVLSGESAIRAIAKAGWREDQRHGSQVILTQTSHPAALSASQHRELAP